MTNQQTNVANAAETTLNGNLAAGATTINVVDGASFPAVPFYIVLDPGNDTKREVALVDSAKSATAFTLSAPAMRGLDGTTDTNHDGGAVVAMVPIAAHWTDINDRVDAGDTATATVQTNLDTHTAATNPHSGSASNASVTTVQTNLDTHTASVAPHSSTTDPTANRLALRNASGQASFADPTAVAHAATKGYVDGLAPFAPTYAAITRVTAQSIPDSTQTAVTFTATDAESPSTFGDHVNGRLVIPETGFYLFGLSAEWASSSIGDRSVFIYIDGASADVASQLRGSLGGSRMSAMSGRSFTSGQLVTAQVQHTHGGPLDLTTARLWAVRIA